MKTAGKITVLCLIAILITSSAFAGGDQNQGDKGQGKVHQNQNRNN